MYELVRVVSCILSLLIVSVSAQAKIEMDRDKIAAWADGFFAKELKEKSFSGAGLSVIQDGEILFSRGYGFEDYQKNIPFDPEHTRVRVCSNSKVVVATGLMQLMERGVIQKLSDPANKYLKRFQLPQHKGTDVTIENLLTHRGGFSLAGFGAGTVSEFDTAVSGETYERLIPNYSAKPGTVSSYANAALAIQGAIIEDQAGQHVGTYLQQNIFDPLGMVNSSYHHHAELPERMAVPYRFYPDGRIEEVAFTAKHPVYAPSGGVVSTTNDMARFLIAHTDEARTSEAPLLSAETYRAMHSQRLSNHPDLFGMGLQFFTETYNGERLAEHGCGLDGFTTRFAIFPDSNTGFFVSVVSEDMNSGIMDEILSAFSDTDPKDRCCTGEAISARTPYNAFLKNILGPRIEDELKPPLPSDQRSALNDYVGNYTLYRSFNGTFLEAFNSIFSDAVELHKDGGLRIAGRGPYLEIAPDFFQHQKNGARKAAFVRGDNGQVHQMLSGSTGAYYKTSGLNNPNNLNLALALSVILSLTGVTAFFWPKANEKERFAAYIPAGIFLTYILAVMSLSLGYGTTTPVQSIEDYLNVGRDLRLWIFVAIINLIAIGCLAMLWFARKAIQGGYWGTGIRARFRQGHYLLIAAAGLFLLPLLWSFHLIGFHIP